MYFVVWSGTVNVICCVQLSVIQLIKINYLYIEIRKWIKSFKSVLCRFKLIIYLTKLYDVPFYVVASMTERPVRGGLGVV